MVLSQNNKNNKFDTFYSTDIKKSNQQLPTILLTGATGFLGNRLAITLSKKGYRIHAIVREQSNIDLLKKSQAEIFYGDISIKESLNQAFEGVSVVIHAAADTTGGENSGKAITVKGTEHIISLCKEYNIKKLIYISTCNVYGTSDYSENQIVTEESSLERFPEKRGGYTNSKFMADQIIAEEIKKGTLPIVCIRPGTIFGPGGELFTPMMGFQVGNKMFGIIGNGKFILPLVYIDNLVDAIITVISKEEANGKVYNIVDMDNLTKKQYVEMILKRIYPKAIFFYIPYSVIYLVVFIQEVLAHILKKNPFLTRYRLISSQKSVKYDITKIKEEIGWSQPLSIKESINMLIEAENSTF